MIQLKDIKSFIFQEIRKEMSKKLLSYKFGYVVQRNLQQIKILNILFRNKIMSIRKLNGIIFMVILRFQMKQKDFNNVK